MLREQQQIDLERSAAKVSIAGRCVIVLVELVIIYVTSSQAILIDTAFDLAELATVILGFVLIPKWFSPRTEKRPYGLAQGENWLVIVRTLLQISMSVVLILINILIITRGGNDIEFDEAALLEFGSAVLAVFVLVILKRRNKALGSPSLASDIESWSVDIVASVGIAAAFFLSVLLDEDVFGWLIPHLDPIIAIAFTLIALIGPLKTLIVEFKSMTLALACPETVDKVNSAAEAVLEKYSLGTPEFYILETGRKTWVSIYITSPAETISKEDYKKAQREIHAALSDEFIDLFVEVLPEIG
jgi:predicted Co/Zn/Cd cation transporter (cation efflux family)